MTEYFSSGRMKGELLKWPLERVCGVGDICFPPGQPGLQGSSQAAKDLGVERTGTGLNSS